MPKDDFICIGHRGASGHAPENTLKAFELAIKLGCQWIELDVYVVEGELLVIHDEKLNRTTNGSGLVEAQTVEYLRSLDAGDGEKIPLLSEVIKRVAHRCKINIELKGTHTAKPVNALLKDFISKGWREDEFMISSFNHEELAASSPDIKRGALFHKQIANMFERAADLNAYAVNLSQKIAHTEIVAQAHERGYQVFVYTVNTRDEMLVLKKMGVDGVFTNFPDLFPSDKP
jgi:glycerophosphoryl diester phosphodiesterase|tara:strand:- start:399 stop:1091 length:693 start_codon:yes stop_codon:yes gene_type:complete